MIATDIDGTLVDDAKNLSPKTIEVLKKQELMAFMLSYVQVVH